MAKEALLKIERRPLFILVIILLAAAALRIIGLIELSPPGLAHDEVAQWLINKDILAGNHGLYFAEAYGHEAGFHYVQVIFTALLGDNILALRLPSVFAGILLVAVCFSLARKLFDVKTALIAAALLAVLFWPLFYSRLALRAISLPLLSGASLYFWWRGWEQAAKDEADRSNVKGLSSNGFFIVAAILAGLSLYTYMASRVVPIFYALYSLYLFVFHRDQFRISRRGIGRFFFVFLLVAAPLALFLLINPGIESRLSEVNQPLVSMLGGDFRPIIENSIKILAMFGISGDPLWRNNIAFLPVFEPLVAIFFYIGVAISFWRYREPRYALLVLWLFSSFIPSIVTIDAPSSIRMINALPIITIFPAIGLKVIHYLRRLSTVSTVLSTKYWRIASIFALSIVFFFYIGRSSRGIFKTWPAEEEVRFVWQEAFSDSAAYLDNSDDSRPVAVGGWTPETMDPPTMELSLKREDLSIRFFDPSTSLILPDAVDGGYPRIIRPTILPLNPILEERLFDWGAEAQEMGSFTLYDLDQVQDIQPEISTNINFGEELALIGYDWIEPCEVGGGCQLITYWQVLSPVGEPRSLFLHLVDSSGQIIAQDDALGAPAIHWQRGDLVLQLLNLDIPPGAEAASLNLGVYHPVTGERLGLSDGSDFLQLKEWTIPEE
ncbi:MAG: hypothetical protein BMS9Abin02_1119 [Anaerolineae bacterium]|nr:MAG: hypothetical protein BMS9Abin02_1119 [Anaerolineae bacterium]